MKDDMDPSNPQSIAYAREQIARQGGGQSEGDLLERQAVALIAQYGWALPAPAKDFFRRLANHLNWEILKGKLK